VEGLDPEVSELWANALCATGGSQCGFCTPGIVNRLASGRVLDTDSLNTALLAHICRCTGWQTIHEAAALVAEGLPVDPFDGRDAALAVQRATIEGGIPQRVAPSIALGAGGFADDVAPPEALVALLNETGEWLVGESVREVRQLAGKVQGRRTTLSPEPPIALPTGEWTVALRTSWVEPAYVEPDATWCVPGGEPVSPLANGGAFGGKEATDIGRVARRLADEHGRAVRVLYTREDSVRRGPKRPPVAGGLRADGSGVLQVASTPGLVALLEQVAPDLDVIEVAVSGPPTSLRLRGAVWTEIEMLRAGLRGLRRVSVSAPGGGRAWAEISDDGTEVRVHVEAGRMLDRVVLRSYCIGAAHQALGFVRSEGIVVDEQGEVHDLTMRSFGLLRAQDTPHIEVGIADGAEHSEAEPVNGSDAVFAAVAAAEWVRLGCPVDLPAQR
jgi:hypothetical protein